MSDGRHTIREINENKKRLTSSAKCIVKGKKNENIESNQRYDQNRGKKAELK